MVQWFVCLSVAMATSQGKGYGTQSIAHFLTSRSYPTIPMYFDNSD